MTTSKLTKISSQGLFLVAATVAIFTFCYLLGHDILEGALEGNDTLWALSQVRWINKWFPDLAIWYPLQGGGSPMLFFYPPLTSVLSVVIHRIAGITEVEALAVVGFLSVPLTAIGIFVLVWRSLGNAAIGLLAGLLYPLSSASWYWLTEMGMYAQAVSIMFIPFALLGFDIYLQGANKAENHHQVALRRIGMALFALFFGMATLSHPATGAVLLLALAIYTIVIPFARYRAAGRSLVLPSIRKAFICVGAGLLLVAFWLVPFVQILGQANREGLSEFAAHQVPYTSLSGILGFGTPSPSVFSAGLTFALPISILALAGLVYAIKRKGPALAWAAVAVSLMLYTSMPGLWQGIVEVFEPIWAFTHARAFAPVIVLVPALAAYGAFGLGNSAVSLLQRILTVVANRRSRESKGRQGRVTAVASTVLALAIAIAATIFLDRGTDGENPYSAYGPPNTASSFSFTVNGLITPFSTAPEYSLTAVAGSLAEASVQSIHSVVPTSDDIRLDVSPYHGGLIQAFGVHSDVSDINVYNYQSSLIHEMWGYQMEVFHGDSDTSETEMNELAKWFGIDYSILHSSFDPLEKYGLDQWRPIDTPSEISAMNIEIREFTERTPIGEITLAPMVLVIGGFDNGIYGQVFRTFMKAGIGYDTALLVEGEHHVDDYKLEELEEFDVLFLHGYEYLDRDSGHQLLEAYIVNGGSVFIDTGWQYWTPDWQLDEVPEFFPVNSLSWTDLGKVSGFETNPAFVTNEIDVSKFSPLIWEDEAWSVSLSPTGLKPWSSPILSIEGKPLVAYGEYGEGKIVWSGMNLISHSQTYDNAEERELIKMIIDLLTPSPNEVRAESLSFLRNHPDRVIFSLDANASKGGSILWREAFYPRWQASLFTSSGATQLPIYRAGPGFMLIPVESSSTPVEVELAWQQSVGDKLAAAGSLLGLVSLLIISIDALFLGGNGIRWTKNAISARIPRPILGEGANEEWARRKRKELERGEVTHGPITNEPSLAINWLRDDTRKSIANSGDEDEQAGVMRGLEAIASENNEEELLEAWLQHPGNAEDDDWVSRMLEGKEKSGKT